MEVKLRPSYSSGLLFMLPERERTAKARGVLWGYFEPLGWCCWDFEALGGGGGVSYQTFL